MNRQQRRMNQRNQTAQIKDVKKAAIESARKQLNDKRVEAMMFCYALALNKILGFNSPEQIIPILEKSDEYMAEWISGAETVESLRTKVRDATGVDVKC